MNLLGKHKVKHVVLKTNGDTQMVELLEPITVYKKLRYFETWERRRYIATMVIPEGTIIHCKIDDSHARCNVCRAEFAIVKDIKTMLDMPVEEVTHTPMTSDYKRHVLYKINDFVFPHKFSTKLKICAAGIHFFFTKKEAEDY